MKCSICGDPVEHGGAALALFHENTFLIALCPIDAAQVFGTRLLRRLRRMSGRAAWIQPRLPSIA